MIRLVGFVGLALCLFVVLAIESTAQIPTEFAWKETLSPEPLPDDSVAFYDRSGSFFVVISPSIISVFDAQTQTKQYVIHGVDFQLPVAFTKDARLVAVSGQDKITIFNIIAGSSSVKFLKIPRVGARDAMLAHVFTDDGKFLLTSLDTLLKFNVHKVEKGWPIKQTIQCGGEIETNDLDYVHPNLLLACASEPSRLFHVADSFKVRDITYDGNVNGEKLSAISAILSPLDPDTLFLTDERGGNRKGWMKQYNVSLSLKTPVREFPNDLLLPRMIGKMVRISRDGTILVYVQGTATLSFAEFPQLVARPPPSTFQKFINIVSMDLAPSGKEILVISKDWKLTTVTQTCLNGQILYDAFTCVECPPGTFQRENQCITLLGPDYFVTNASMSATKRDPALCTYLTDEGLIKLKTYVREGFNVIRQGKTESTVNLTVFLADTAVMLDRPIAAGDGLDFLRNAQGKCGNIAIRQSCSAADAVCATFQASWPQEFTSENTLEVENNGDLPLSARFESTHGELSLLVAQGNNAPVLASPGDVVFFSKGVTSFKVVFDVGSYDGFRGPSNRTQVRITFTHLAQFWNQSTPVNPPADISTAFDLVVTKPRLEAIPSRIDVVLTPEDNFVSTTTLTLFNLQSAPIAYDVFLPDASAIGLIIQASQTSSQLEGAKTCKATSNDSFSAELTLTLNGTNVRASDHYKFDIVVRTDLTTETIVPLLVTVRPGKVDYERSFMTVANRDKDGVLVYTTPSENLQFEVIPRDRHGVQTALLLGNEILFLTTVGCTNECASATGMDAQFVFSPTSLTWTLSVIMPLGNVSVVGKALVPEVPREIVIGERVVTSVPVTCSAAGMRPHPVFGNRCICSAGYRGIGGQEGCAACPEGSSGIDGENCNDCENGMVQPLAGSTKCVPCGALARSDKRLKCQPCPPDSFVRDALANVCEPCASGETVVRIDNITSFLDQSSEPALGYMCDCKPGTRREDGQNCTQCPPGVFCSRRILESGASRSQLVVDRSFMPRKGYFVVEILRSPSSTSTDLHSLQCPIEASCLGLESSVSEDDPDNSKQVTAVSNYLAKRETDGSLAFPSFCGFCAKGYMGGGCMTCAPGYTRAYAASTDSLSECVPCVDPGVIAVLFLLAVIVISGLAIFIIRKSLEEEAEGRAEGKSIQMDAATIIIAHMQELMMLLQITLRWPSWLVSVSSALEAAASFGFIMLTTSCIGRAPSSDISKCGNSSTPITLDQLQQAFNDVDAHYPTFFMDAIVVAMLPCILAVGAFFIWRILLRHVKQSIKGLKSTIVTGMLVLYPLLSRTGLLFFVCTKENIAGMKFLRADTNYQCFGTTHLNYIAIGVIILVVYVVGSPVALAWHIRKKMVSESATDFTFIYGSYKPKYSLWEFASLFRRLLLAFTVTVLYPYGSDIQLVVASFVLVSSLLLQGLLNPRANPVSNKYESAGLYLNLVSLFLMQVMASENISQEAILALSTIIVVINGLFLLLLIHLIFQIAFDWTLKQNEASNTETSPGQSNAATASMSKPDNANQQFRNGNSAQHVEDATTQQAFPSNVNFHEVAKA